MVFVPPQRQPGLQRVKEALEGLEDQLKVRIRCGLATQLVDEDADLDENSSQVVLEMPSFSDEEERQVSAALGGLGCVCRLWSSARSCLGTWSSSASPASRTRSSYRRGAEESPRRGLPRLLGALVPARPARR